MLNVILTVHLLACIAMVAVIMLQRSEGGVQGLSGGGTGGIISGRGAASVLIRTTMICAGIFFCTSLIMTRLNSDEGAKPNDYEKELQKVNSGSSILGATPTPAPDAATTAAPTPAPAATDPFAALTPTPTGLPTAAPTPAPSASSPAPAPTAASPRPSASAPAPAPATNTPAATPSPANSPQ